MPQPVSLMGAPRPGYRAVSNNLRMAGRGDFGEYLVLYVVPINNIKGGTVEAIFYIITC